MDFRLRVNQEKQMNIEKITESYLKDYGYDGLCNPDFGCGCLLEDDLMPCWPDGLSAKCEPGYKIDDPDNPGDWIVSTEKKGEQHETE